MREKPLTSACPDRRRRFVPSLRLASFGLITGLVVAWGSDRQPADVTAPIVWYGQSPYVEPSDDVLRIASFNIHSGKGADNRLDLTRTCRALQDVDFAGLFEVRARAWNLFPSQAGCLADQLQMRTVFLPTERRWWHDHFGNALLTARPVAGIQRIPLIGTRGKAFRQAVLVDIPLQGETVHIVMVHLDSERDREQQLAAVIRLFLSLEAPAVLMGDLNTRQNDSQLAALLSQPGVASAIHAQLEKYAPTNNIDWIITRGLECVSAAYDATDASDHPIVKAELRLPR